MWKAIWGQSNIVCKKFKTIKGDAQKVYAPGTTPQQHSFSLLERYMKQN